MRIDHRWVGHGLVGGGMVGRMMVVQRRRRVRRVRVCIGSWATFTARRVDHDRSARRRDSLRELNETR